MMQTNHLRCLDPLIPPKANDLPLIDVSTLPFECERIPLHVSSLSDCARWQIQILIHKTRLTEQEEDAIDDGFVLCDLNVIRRKLVVWRRLFPRIKPFFAIKCNPDPMVTAVLGQYQDQVGFDCASLSEIRLALEYTDKNARRCIYANPQRAENDLDTALSLGVEALTFDGSEELLKVHRAHEKRNDDTLPPEMILRILVPDDSSSVPLGEKFGASPERIESLAKEAVALGLPIVGVSFHCGSGCHDPHAYCKAIGLAKEAMQIVDCVQSGLGIECRLLDIGGGYPGFDGSEHEYGRFVGEHVCMDSNDAISEEETTASIALAVTPLLEELFPLDDSRVNIISEPGRYFVEAAYAVCSRIYSVRVEKDENDVQVHRHYYIAQGVQGVFKDVLLCGEEFIPIPLKMETSREENSEPLCASTVHGPSGRDFDIVCKARLLPKLNVGDWLLFDRMGAYTLSIAARSGTLPIRHVMGGS